MDGSLKWMDIGLLAMFSIIRFVGSMDKRDLREHPCIDDDKVSSTSILYSKSYSHLDH